jgi:uncharacterized membrane protein YqjE
MAEHWKDSRLPNVLAEVVGDVADLLQKEVRLARVEITQKVTAVLTGGGWMAGAAFLGALAVLVVVEAIIFAIAARGISVPLACIIVAAGLFVLGACAFFYGKQQAAQGVAPDRTLRQVQQDIRVAKEQLS